MSAGELCNSFAVGHSKLPILRSAANQMDLHTRLSLRITVKKSNELKVKNQDDYRWLLVES